MPQRNLALFDKQTGEVLQLGTRRELKIWLRNSTEYDQKNTYFGSPPAPDLPPPLPFPEETISTTSMEDQPNPEGFFKKIFK